MARSNVHTSLQMVRASGEGAATSLGKECVGSRGSHRQTRCAVRNVPRHLFPVEKNFNGRMTPAS